ncbi:MAG: monovalent cation/H+ antiporter subunit D family protein, partial [Deltaproteobacteria bacterium]|nr:monovalent cation/H+ antiporter subunit D family protein [Deltaproteobacteria bacterium]
METIITSKIVLTPLIPLVTALLIMASKNKPNLRETWSVCGAVLTFLSVVYFLPRLLGGGSYEYTMFTLYPGVSVKFQLDGLGILFAGTSSFLWIMAGFYCLGYMRGLDEHAQTRFYFCYAVAVGGAMGAAFSA